MSLEELLNSLSGSERNYIAGLDYENDEEKHREQLDLVIQCGGTIKMTTQYWFPYEVIELCKSHLEEGHEREFASCLGIVLKNMFEGNDQSNDIDFILDCVTPYVEKLPPELKSIVDRLVDEFIARS